MKRPYSALISLSALVGLGFALAACNPMPPTPPEPLLPPPAALWPDESAQTPFCAINPQAPSCPPA